MICRGCIIQLYYYPSCDWIWLCLWQKCVLKIKVRRASQQVNWRKVRLPQPVDPNLCGKLVRFLGVSRDFAAPRNGHKIVSSGLGQCVGHSTLSNTTQPRAGIPASRRVLKRSKSWFNRTIYCSDDVVIRDAVDTVKETATSDYPQRRIDQLKMCQLVEVVGCIVCSGLSPPIWETTGHKTRLFQLYGLLTFPDIWASTVQQLQYNTL